MGWQMAVLDTGGTVAPLGLKIVSSIDLLLALPVCLPLARLALHFGFADPVNDPLLVTSHHQQLVSGLLCNWNNSVVCCPAAGV